jgi:hypothetical protein
MTERHEPDFAEVEAIVQEIDRLRSMIRRWADLSVGPVRIDGRETTPRELAAVLDEAAVPWERARAAWAVLRRFESELPVKSRQIVALLGELRSAIACALGPEEASRLLSRPRRRPRAA